MSFAFALIRAMLERHRCPLRHVANPYASGCLLPSLRRSLLFPFARPAPPRGALVLNTCFFRISTYMASTKAIWACSAQEYCNRWAVATVLMFVLVMRAKPSPFWLQFFRPRSADEQSLKRSVAVAGVIIGCEPGQQHCWVGWSVDRKGQSRAPVRRGSRARLHVSV